MGFWRFGPMTIEIPMILLSTILYIILRRKTHPQPCLYVFFQYRWHDPNLVQSNLDLPTPPYAYFRFTYLFFIFYTRITLNTYSNLIYVLCLIYSNLIYVLCATYSNLICVLRVC
jgi:hypothetical protein